MKLHSKAITTVALCLMLTSCSTTQVIESLQVVTTAATAAVDALGAAVPAEVLTYLTAVNNGISCASTELQSSDPVDVQAAKITACFAAAVAPNIPGIGGVIGAAVSAVASALAAFLAHYPSPAQIRASAGTHVSLTRGDHRALGSMQHQASVNIGKLGTKTKQ